MECCADAPPVEGETAIAKVDTSIDHVAAPESPDAGLLAGVGGQPDSETANELKQSEVRANALDKVRKHVVHLYRKGALGASPSRSRLTQTAQLLWDLASPSDKELLRKALQAQDFSAGDSVQALADYAAAVVTRNAGGESATNPGPPVNGVKLRAIRTQRGHSRESGPPTKVGETPRSPGRCDTCGGVTAERQCRTCIVAESNLTVELLDARRTLLDYFKYVERKASRVEIDHVVGVLIRKNGNDVNSALREQLPVIGYQGPLHDALYDFAVNELRGVKRLAPRSRLVIAKEISGGAPGNRRGH